MELKGGPTLQENFVDMAKTEVVQTSINHRDATNMAGRIYGGFVLNKTVQVAVLSMIELCELSIKSMKDAEGN